MTPPTTRATISPKVTVGAYAPHGGESALVCRCELAHWPDRVPRSPDRHHIWRFDKESSDSGPLLSEQPSSEIEFGVPYAEVDDINVFYEVHGNGTPLVLIPGLGSNTRYFAGLPESSPRGVRSSWLSEWDLHGRGLQIVAKLSDQWA